MNPNRMSFLVAPLVVALAACGGTAQEEEFRAAAPSTAAFSVDVDAGGATAVAGAAEGITSLAATAEPLQPEPCHPLLFARSEAVARRLNRHLAHALGRIERVIARHPALARDGEMVWQEQRDGLDVRFTMTRSGDVFTWLLELRPAGGGDDAWVTVFSGNIDRSGASARHEGKGALALDLDALHAVAPDLDVAGTIRATFDLTAARRLVTLNVGGVRWDPDLGGGLRRVSPRDATYTYLREPGVGGSLVLVDELVFACPANPSLLPADVTLVSRWVRTASGEIHGRSDALATGGQLATGEAWMGVTCHARAADPRTTPSEFYWMIKAEDAAGATVESWERTVGSGACDEVFGPVPSRTDGATDFDFGFDPTVPYPFPGMF